MDADDISLEKRLEKQYAYMEKHPDVILCGCAVEDFGERNILRFYILGNKDDYRIKCLFYYPGPPHPTMFLRREVLVNYAISYNEELKYAQDYGLCADISICTGNVYSLTEVLLKRRFHRGRITAQQHETQAQCSMVTQKKLLEGLLKNISDEEVSLHYRWFYDKCFHNFLDAYECIKWCMRLIKANCHTGMYSRKKFDLFTVKLFLLVFGQSFLSSASMLITTQRIKMLIQNDRMRH